MGVLLPGLRRLLLRWPQASLGLGQPEVAEAVAVVEEVEVDLQAAVPVVVETLVGEEETGVGCRADS